MITYQLLLGDVTASLRPDWRTDLQEVSVSQEVIAVVDRCVAHPSRRFPHADALVGQVEALRDAGLFEAPLPPRPSVDKVAPASSVQSPQAPVDVQRTTGKPDQGPRDQRRQSPVAVEWSTALSGRKRYMLHTVSSVTIATYMAILIVGLFRLGDGPASWWGWLDAMASPIGMIFGVIAFVVAIINLISSRGSIYRPNGTAAPVSFSKPPPTHQVNVATAAESSGSHYKEGDKSAIDAELSGRPVQPTEMIETIPIWPALLFLIRLIPLAILAALAAPLIIFILAFVIR